MLDQTTTTNETETERTARLESRRAFLAAQGAQLLAAAAQRVERNGNDANARATLANAAQRCETPNDTKPHATIANAAQLRETSLNPANRHETTENHSKRYETPGDGRPYTTLIDPTQRCETSRNDSKPHEITARPIVDGRGDRSWLASFAANWTEAENTAVFVEKANTAVHPLVIAASLATGAARVSPSIWTAAARDYDVPLTMWVLLRAYDQEATKGGGYLPLATVRELLTDAASPIRLFGRRQLRTMIGRGEGIFWRSIDGKHGRMLALVSRENIAAHFGTLLSGSEIAIPVADLIRGRGRARQANANAALYTAVHGGRKSAGKPISRNTIKTITGVSRSTQKRYERRAGVFARRNFRLNESFSDYALERARYSEQRAAFEFTDYRGRAGTAGARYVAEAMPNSYDTPRRYERVGSRRQRTINKSLRNLRFMGNADRSGGGIVRYYHEDAGKAAAAYGKSPDTPNYWPVPGARTNHASVWRANVPILATGTA
jgi:hypothetical protein